MILPDILKGLVLFHESDEVQKTGGIQRVSRDVKGFSELTLPKPGWQRGEVVLGDEEILDSLHPVREGRQFVPAQVKFGHIDKGGCREERSVGKRKKKEKRK